MGEGIGYVFLEYLLVSPWCQCRLEERATLPWGKYRVGLAGHMADMHQRQVCTAPVFEQLSNLRFSLRVVTRCADALDALLHVDDQQRGYFDAIDWEWMHFDRPWLWAGILRADFNLRAFSPSAA